MKIIPAIDLMDGKVVRLYKGKAEQKTIYSDEPLDTAQKWESSGADLLHIVDLDATLGKGSNLEIIKQIASTISIPIEVAGGLRNESIIRQALDFSPRVVLGTIAYENRNLLNQLLNEFGNSRMVISTDYIDGKIVVKGWKENTGIDLISGINDFLESGFTEFLVTNVNLDGTLQGPDLEYLSKICQLENANIIASGGISKLDDVVNVNSFNAFGVILGKALYEKQITIEEAKNIV